MNEGSNGHGFLRAEKYLPGPNDAYVSAALIRRFDLRTGDQITGSRAPNAKRPLARPRPYRDGQWQQGIRIAPARPLRTIHAIFPNQRYTWKRTHVSSPRACCNLIAPIGRGQRGLIVSPPKAGKTTVLKEIATPSARITPKFT